jgi:predicted nucleic acid-binding protein
MTPQRCEEGSLAAVWLRGWSRIAVASVRSVKACLDSWAVLAWLDGDEPAAAAVAKALERERPVMSWINLVEVRYRLARDHGRDEAERAISDLRSQINEDLPGVSAMRAVASLKAEHPIALADCFAIALAEEDEAVLMTGDPEIIDRVRDLPCEVKDLR